MSESRNWTNDQLEKLEKELYNIYNEAGVGLTLKAREFLADMQRMDEVRRKQVKDGEWTEEQYKEWRKNKLLYFGKYKRLMETVQREMLEVNKKAIQILNGETPKIFAHNYNSIVESFPDSPVEGFTFELVDAETVKRLATSGELMLPPKKDFDPKKDAAWNGKQVNAQILQGILQGESIPKIAERMADICESNHVAMVRTARTLVTAAENSGRQAGMNKAEEGGMIFEKIWMAATDARTRDSHLDLNGKKVKNGEKFKSITGAELEFPGDWRAPGYEVYNCRCSLGTHYIGFKKGIIHKEIENTEGKGIEKPKEKPKDIKKKENKLSDTTLKILKDNFKDNMSEEEYKKLIKLLEGNPLQAKLMETYAINVEKFVNDHSHAYWQFAFKELHWHLESKSDKTTYSTIFHELGHVYDQYLKSSNVTYGEIDKLRKIGIMPSTMYDRVFKSIPSSSDEFLEAMRKDITKVKGIIDSDERDKIDPMVTGYTSGIQDFISGALGYDYKYRGEIRWQHSEEYYNRRYNDWVKRFNSVKETKAKLKDADMTFKNEKEIKQYMRQFETASELWANINSANACGGAELEKFKEYCPNSYDAYLKIMEGRE